MRKGLVAAQVSVQLRLVRVLMVCWHAVLVGLRAVRGAVRGRRAAHARADRRDHATRGQVPQAHAARHLCGRYVQTLDGLYLFTFHTIDGCNSTCTKITCIGRGYQLLFFCNRLASYASF